MIFQNKNVVFLVLSIVYIISLFCVILYFSTGNNKPSEVKREKINFYCDYVLNCHICLENYSSQAKPICLPTCGHTFCVNCLSELMHSETAFQIKCPVCRQITDVPLEGLPLNYIFAEMFENEMSSNERDIVSIEGRRKIRNHSIEIEESEKEMQCAPFTSILSSVYQTLRACIF